MASASSAGPARSADYQRRQARRLSRYALLVCALTVVAAVVSFVQGNWLGIVWVLLAGLSSNMAWYYHRRAAS